MTSTIHSPEESKLEAPEKLDENLFYHVLSEEGITSVESIDFKLDKQFKSGSYAIICRDVTKGLDKQ